MVNKTIKQQNTSMNDEGFLPWEGKRCFHVAVVGTMSSGKSTLIDALLGTDCMPNANLACTAKIISVCQSGDMKKIVGFTVSRNEKSSPLERATRERMDEWNKDNEIERIVLCGKAMRGRPKFPLLVLHDTPGTNDAFRREHLEHVVSFLKSCPVDLVLFVINANHNGTDDQKILASNIYNTVVASRKVPVFFVINKLDDFDTEKENLQDTLDQAAQDMKDVGFENPVVLPMSAKAARVFQLALEGKHLSASERRVLNNPLFVSDEGDFRCLISPSLQKYRKKRRSLAFGRNVEEIALRTAIQRTGLTMLQDTIQYEMSKKNEKSKRSGDQ